MADHNVDVGADDADLIKLTDETITEKIRQMLVNGAFDAETTITETNLSRKLGVSRTPVRTALKVLAAEGFLTARDGRGYIARAFSKKDILVLLQLVIIYLQYICEFYFQVCGCILEKMRFK